MSFFNPNQPLDRNKLVIREKCHEKGFQLEQNIYICTIVTIRIPTDIGQARAILQKDKVICTNKIKTHSLWKTHSRNFLQH